MITKRGNPVAKLVPVNSQTNEIYNFMAGKGVVTGDVVSPAISTADWDWLEQF
jgi:antitoxin (DNA-binding transcriptional repressor) of toxin-antitoxin stability system